MVLIMNFKKVIKSSNNGSFSNNPLENDLTSVVKILNMSQLFYWGLLFLKLSYENS